MLWPREWWLLLSAFAIFVVLTLALDCTRDWQLAKAVDRAAHSWLQSVVCDRASADTIEEVP